MYLDPTEGPEAVASELAKIWLIYQRLTLNAFITAGLDQASSKSLHILSGRHTVKLFPQSEESLGQKIQVHWTTDIVARRTIEHTMMEIFKTIRHEQKHGKRREYCKEK